MTTFETWQTRVWTPPMASSPAYLHPRRSGGRRQPPVGSSRPVRLPATAFSGTTTRKTLCSDSAHVPEVGVGTCGLLKAPDKGLFRVDPPPTRPGFPNPFFEETAAQKEETPQHQQQKATLNCVSAAAPRLFPAGPFPASEPSVSWLRRRAWARARTLMFGTFRFWL